MIDADIVPHSESLEPCKRQPRRTGLSKSRVTRSLPSGGRGVAFTSSLSWQSTTFVSHPRWPRVLGALRPRRRGSRPGAGHRLRGRGSRGRPRVHRGRSWSGGGIRVDFVDGDLGVGAAKHSRFARAPARARIRHEVAERAEGQLNLEGEDPRVCWNTSCTENERNHTRTVCMAGMAKKNARSRRTHRAPSLCKINRTTRTQSNRLIVLLLAQQDKKSNPEVR